MLSYFLTIIILECEYIIGMKSFEESHFTLSSVMLSTHLLRCVLDLETNIGIMLSVGVVSILIVVSIESSIMIDGLWLGL